MTNYARIRRTYTPGVGWLGVGFYVGECSLSNGPHSGILGFGNDGLFENNLLRDLAYEATDSGAWYSLYTHTQTQTQRERERERFSLSLSLSLSHTHTHTPHTHTHTHTHTNSHTHTRSLSHTGTRGVVGSGVDM